MTIAAGFVCSDGLLFASDTLYSGGLTRRKGRKFWGTEWGETTVIFGGAGTVRGLLRTHEEIERRAKPTTDHHDVLEGIEEALRVVEAKMNPAPDERTSALVGIRARGRCWLYENQGGGNMLSVVDTPTQCVGFGYPLGLYFTNSLFNSQMTMEWAKRVAAHMVYQVKVHSSGWCGGSTNLIELPLDGAPVKWLLKKKEVQPYEQYLAEISGAMKLVLPNKRINTDTAQSRVERINEALRSLEKQFFLRTEPGELKLSGTLTATLKKREGTE